MQRLEFSGAVRPLLRSLGVKGLSNTLKYTYQIIVPYMTSRIYAFVAEC